MCTAYDLARGSPIMPMLWPGNSQCQFSPEWQSEYPNSHTLCWGYSNSGRRLCQCTATAPPQEWFLGEPGATCLETCEGSGNSCREGRLGADDRESLDAALEVAGENPTTLCQDNYAGSQEGWGPQPGVTTSTGNVRCEWKGGGVETHCGVVPEAGYRRLCRCILGDYP